jgi:hypothetical protein
MEDAWEEGMTVFCRSGHLERQSGGVYQAPFLLLIGERLQTPDTNIR